MGAGGCTSVAGLCLSCADGPLLLGAAVHLFPLLSPVTLGKRPILAPTLSYPDVHISFSNLILLLDFITEG